MLVEGEPDDFFLEIFPHGLVPQILRLIVDTWGTFRRPLNDEDEPKITNRFVLALQTEGRRQRVRFRIMPHVKDVEGVHQDTGKGFVEIDIYVPYGYETRCYFGVEAKKLNTTTNGKWESQAGDYAGPNGMGCFIGGRYATYQCEGGMLGYVMDGDCERAKMSINESINNRADSLCVSAPCVLNMIEHLPDQQSSFETKHNLPRGEFTLFHILVAA